MCSSTDVLRQVCHNELQEEQEQNVERLRHPGKGIKEEGDDVANSTNAVQCSGPVQVLLVKRKNSFPLSMGKR